MMYATKLTYTSDKYCRRQHKEVKVTIEDSCNILLEYERHSR